jgi:hypothetical protein
VCLELCLFCGCGWIFRILEPHQRYTFLRQLSPVRSGEKPAKKPSEANAGRVEQNVTKATKKGGS